MDTTLYGEKFMIENNLRADDFPTHGHISLYSFYIIQYWTKVSTPHPPSNFTKSINEMNTFLFHRNL